MKNLTTILLAIILTTTLFAQAPEKMSYQAVVRDGNNSLVINATVGIRISILQGSAFGAAVYVETQTPNTNANGLASIEIGSGTMVNGDFATIDWANGPYFIKTETDPAGGTNYSITGTSELLSVPYALYAKTAGSSVPFYLGKDTLGGIVYYIYNDSIGEQHGLIVAKTQSAVQGWQTSASLTNADRTWDGKYNTNLMTNSPAKDYVTNNFGTEWYLPSIDELNLLCNNRFHVDKDLTEGGHQILGRGIWWSSTETNATDAYHFDFNTCASNYGSKTTTQLFIVRAVRAF